MMRALILAAALLAAPAVAQKPTSPDTAALTAARALMQAADIRGQMRATAPRIAEAVARQTRQMFAENAVPEGLWAEMTAATHRYMASLDSALTPDVIDRMAMIYARHFTAAELQHLTALMGDPVMAKFRARTPEITAELMPVMFEAMKPQQDAFQAEMKRIVAGWLRKHPEDKQKLRSSDPT